MISFEQFKDYFIIFKLLFNVNMSVKLPEDIDYSKYTSTQGMSTKHWGPSAWNFLFTSIMGRYPVKVDFHSEEDVSIANKFSHMLVGLKDIMPCIYCRKSFENFAKELPIEPYLVGRIELMYWLYLMKDKVNNKLEKQEQKCYTDEKKRLKGLYHHGDITKEEYYKLIESFKKETFITQASPSFKEVLDHYESIRAVCSEKAMRCTIKPNDDSL
jgi:hypothetical protein